MITCHRLNWNAHFNTALESFGTHYFNADLEPFGMHHFNAALESFGTHYFNTGLELFGTCSSPSFNMVSLSFVRVTLVSAVVSPNKPAIC